MTINVQVRSKTRQQIITKSNYSEPFYSITVRKTLPLVREALKKLGREDLIGFGAECLVKPEKSKNLPSPSYQKVRKNSSKQTKEPLQQTKSQKRKTSLSKHIKNKKNGKK